MDDLTVDIHDKKCKLLAPLGAFHSLSVTPVWNGIGTAALMVPARHHRAPMLAADGARLAVNFRGKQILSGPIHQVAGSGPERSGYSTYGVTGDFTILHDFRGWPNPAGTAAQQGDEGSNWVRRGPAETVVKDLVRANVVQRANILARLGYALQIPVTQGRGATIDVSIRMQKLYDKLFPAVDDASIGVVFGMGDGFLTMDVAQPRLKPNPLRESDRVIQKWDYQGETPTVSRGVVGGQGEGTARVFQPFEDAAREQKYGRIVETFIDARDTSDGTTHAMRGQAALSEGAARASMRVTLAEAGSFRLGVDDYWVGDFVTAQAGPYTFADLLREVTIVQDQASGLKVTATIGPDNSPERAVTEAISRLARNVGDLRTGR